MSGRSSARLRKGPAIAASASSRGSRRKRDDGEEQQLAAEDAAPAAAASASSASASSAPDSKRRRSSRTRLSASAAAAEKKETEEEEEAADEDGTKGPQDDAEDEEADEESAAEGEAQDGDAAMTDAAESPLDSLRVSNVGHLFSAATASGRPALPLLAVARVLDFLSAADIVQRVAPTARAAYATAVHYGEMVAQRATSEAAATAAGAKKGRKRGGGSAAAPSAAVSSIGRRSEVGVVTSARSLNLLCRSRLRFIVTGLHTRIAKKKGADVFPLDARLLSRISDAIPTLTSLQCQLSSSIVQPAFEFPTGLRELNLALMVFLAPYVPAAKRKSRFTKLAESWTGPQCDTFAEWALEKVAELPHLTTLTLRTCASLQRRSRSWRSQQFFSSPKPSWIEPLVSAPSLRQFTCGLDPAYSPYWDSSESWAPAFRSLHQIETLDGAMVQHHLAEIVKEPHQFKRLQRLPLDSAELTDTLLEGLKSLSASLTDLRPHSITYLDDVSFLHEFTKIRFLSLFEGQSAEVYGPPTEFAPAAPEPRTMRILKAIESFSPARRAQIESIGVGSDSWTNEWVQRLLTALPGLTEYELRSKAVTSLAFFSSVPHLRFTLKVLRLRTPTVPRDEVSHLHSLLQLQSLSIAGSFSEPLFAKQLFAFEPPYPKRPLHWLRSFVARSEKEPVPTPSLDAAAKAAADAEFAARVRAGGVCSAELLNSAELSVMMQFLSMKDFSVAARSCRSWRAAGALPSSWSQRHPAVAGDAMPSVSGLSPVPWFGSASLSYDDYSGSVSPKLELRISRTRILHLSSSQPVCRPSILPSLSLWSSATAVVLEHPNQYGYYDYYGQTPSTVEAERQSLIAISKLKRVESLSVTFSRETADFADQLFTQLEKLRYLEVSGLPSSAFSRLGALTELRTTGQIGEEVAELRQLKRLSMVRCGFAVELAIALRQLSRDHQLLEMSLEAVDLSSLLSVLAGQAVTVAARYLHRTPALAPAPQPPVDEIDLDGVIIPPAPVQQLVPPTFVPPAQPALLTRLRVVQSMPFSIASILRMPKLRQLEIHEQDGALVDLTPLEEATRAGAALPPIEVLLVSSTSIQGLSCVVLLSASLRELRLSSQQGYYHQHEPIAQESNQRWSSVLASLKQLAILALDGVQVSPEDVSSLDQLPNLRALTLNRQKSLRVRDLTVLPRIARLAELQLDENPLLLLQTRDWMKDIGRRRPDESAATVAETKEDAASTVMADVDEQQGSEAAGDADADAPLAAAASSAVPALAADTEGVLSLLLQCRSLRLLRWTSTQEHLVAHQRYTSLHSWVKVSSALRFAYELQQHRLNKEYARERQALRTLIAANPELRVGMGVDLGYHGQVPRRSILLPPADGSIAAAEVQAAVEKARGTTEYDTVVAQSPLLQAFEDRALLGIEAEEEAEWRADAEEKAAKGKSKPKRRNRY